MAISEIAIIVEHQVNEQSRARFLQHVQEAVLR
jgi:hypothetical protein